MENDLAAIASRAETARFRAAVPRRGSGLRGVGGRWARDAPSSRSIRRTCKKRRWAGNAGELLGKWDTMTPGGAGWLLSAGQVEKWVREAVTKGVAAASVPGEQMPLFEDV